MFPPKNLNLSPPGTNPLNQSVNFVRLPARLPHLADDHVRIQPSIRPRGELERTSRRVDDCFDANKHMFFGVVEPVAGASGANHPLELFPIYMRLGNVYVDRDGTRTWLVFTQMTSSTRV